MHIHNLLEGLADQSLVLPSRTEAPEGAEIIGEISDDLKKLFSLMVEVNRQFERAILDRNHCDEEEKLPDLTAKAVRLRAEHDLLQSLFWYEVRASANIFSQREIRVDKDWQLYYLPEASDLIARIFGPSSGQVVCNDPNCPCHSERGASQQVN
jgi:hypothetical protein